MRGQVVFHLSELEKWPVALANLNNLLKEAPELAVELVVNGPAVQEYGTKTYQAAVEHLQKRGVVFSACQNALSAHHLSATDLLAAVQIVPAGVYRLVQLQQAGWAYIKV